MNRAIVCSANGPFAEAVKIFFRDWQIPVIVAETQADLIAALESDREAVAIQWAGDGFDAVHKVRALRDRLIQSLVITIMPPMGPSAPKHRALALNAGADDAQTWPLDGKEFVERFRAICRRTRASEDGPVRFGDGLEFYPKSGLIRGDRVEVQLPKREADLFNCLSSRPEVVVPFEVIMRSLYSGVKNPPHPDIIKVLCAKVRRKLGPMGGGLDFIDSHWGRGYRFVPEGFESRRGTNGARLAG
jgi:two-component system cell cycle response regulator CtrA